MFSKAQGRQLSIIFIYFLVLLFCKLFFPVPCETCIEVPNKISYSLGSINTTYRHMWTAKTTTSCIQYP